MMQYQLKYNEQMGCCDMCHNQFEKLYVDYDFQKKCLKRLLCHDCNMGLGYLYSAISKAKI